MHGTLTLTQTSPVQTFTEPLTLAEVQAYLGVPVLSPVDTESDTLIEAMISSAREVAEGLQGRDLVSKQYDLSLPYFYAPEINLRAPLASVDLVKYKDSDGVEHTLTAETDYIVDTVRQPGVIMPPYGEDWPTFTAWPTSAVTIRFTSGYASADAFWADSGKRVKMGMLMLISHWYNNRLPFDAGQQAQNFEYPFTVTSLLSSGALELPR